MFTKLWNAISPPMAAAIIVPATSLALTATEIHSIAVSNRRIMTAILPLNPNSSPITANMKSVSASDRKLPFFTDVISLFLYPLPSSSPDPIAITEFSCWYARSVEYSSGFTKARIRFFW